VPAIYQQPWDKEVVSTAVNAAQLFADALQGYRQTSAHRALAPCCFHDERTASLHLDIERKLFHCFGCGAGGDIFTFVMKRENIRFPQAVEILARYAGLEGPASMSAPATIESRKLAARRREEIRRYAAEIRTAINCSIDQVREAERVIAAACGIDISPWSEQRLDDEIETLSDAHEIMEKEYGN
jgi:hypothetical protein